MLDSCVKTKDGTQPIRAYTEDEIILTPVKFEKFGHNKTVYEYAADFAVLDTETSHSDLTHGWIYQWAVKWNGQYIYGRRPSELIAFLQDVQE